MNTFTPKIRNSLKFEENVAISGQKIQFIGDRVVKSGSRRLIKQAQKQEWFSLIIKEGKLFSPKILSIDTDSFSMEKVNGQSWLDFFNYSDIGQIEEFFQRIIVYLSGLKRQPKAHNWDKPIAHKIEDLSTTSRHKKFLQYLSPLPRGRVPLTFCHGDLTLSNVIFNDKGYYLIDFLDSFVESYWIDIIKLRQDAFYKWCLLYNGINSARYHIILNKLNDILIYSFKDEINNPTFQILEALNILRIEPYIPKDKSHIIDQMLSINPLYVKFNRSSLR